MRIHSIRTATLCAIVAVAPFASGAQQVVNHTWPVATDSRVRIYSPLIAEKMETGTVVSTTADSIVLRPTKDVGYRSLAISDINRMEIVDGTHTRKLKGAGWGFLIGGALAAGITAATWRAPKDQIQVSCGPLCGDIGRGGESALAGVVGGTCGLIVGALIGSRATDTWVPVGLR
jgi:hypothetical protein